MEFVGIGIVVLIVAGLIYVASRPGSFAIGRSIAIKAPPEAIYKLIADFRNWRDWSPWESVDPQMTRDYSGAESGVGAVYAYEGVKAGAGRMEIVEENAPGYLRLTLDFFRPMKAHNMCEWVLSPEGEETVVSWAMSGPQGFAGKLAGVLLNTDKLVGRDFERGLAQLKALVEAGAPDAGGGEGSEAR